MVDARFCSPLVDQFIEKMMSGETPDLSLLSDKEEDELARRLISISGVSPADIDEARHEIGLTRGKIRDAIRQGKKQAKRLKRK